MIALLLIIALLVVVTSGLKILYWMFRLGLAVFMLTLSLLTLGGLMVLAACHG